MSVFIYLIVGTLVICAIGVGYCWFTGNRAVDALRSPESDDEDPYDEMYNKLVNPVKGLSEEISKVKEKF